MEKVIIQRTLAEKRKRGKLNVAKHRTVDRNGHRKCNERESDNMTEWRRMDDPW